MIVKQVGHYFAMGFKDIMDFRMLFVAVKCPKNDSN